MTAPPPIKAEGEAIAMSDWRYRAVVWSVCLAAVTYLCIVLWSGWKDVINAVSKVGLLGLCAVLSLSLVNYGLRFIRWQAYLGAMNHPIPWWPSLKIYIAGFALTTTPGKAGEVLRGVLLKRWGMTYPKSLAAFLSERLSDLLAVVSLTLFGLTVYPTAQPLFAIGIAALLAFFVGISSKNLLERCQNSIQGASRIRMLLRHIIEILIEARHCHAPLLLSKATGLSILAWGAEAYAFHLILKWMGLEVSLPFAIFVYAISMLAGALSFMPGGLGGTEAMMIGLLVWKGTNSTEAIAATLLIRIATLWFAVGLGCIAMLNFGLLNIFKRRNQ